MERKALGYDHGQIFMREGGYQERAPFSSPYWQAKRSPYCSWVLQNFFKQLIVLS